MATLALTLHTACSFCSRLSTLLSSIVLRFPSFEALAIAFRDSVYTTHPIYCSLLQILVSVWLKTSSCMRAVPKYIATLTFLHLSCVIGFKFGHLKSVRTKWIWFLAVDNRVAYNTDPSLVLIATWNLQNISFADTLLPAFWLEPFSIIAY